MAQQGRGSPVTSAPPTGRQGMRRRVWIAPACLAAAGLGLAGCGGGGAQEGPTRLHIESYPPYAAPDLGGGDWTLRCDPPGGTLPGAARACAALVAKPS